MSKNLNKEYNIRSSSGKIYGPYKKSTIIGLILDKRLKGDEDILQLGQSSWKKILSDLDFFDAFQGKNPYSQQEKTKTKFSSKNETAYDSDLNQEKTLINIDKTQVSSESTVVLSENDGTKESPQEKPPQPKEDKKVEAPKKNKIFSGNLIKRVKADPSLLENQYPENIEDVSYGTKKIERPVARQKEKSPIFLPLLTLLLLLFAVFYFASSNKYIKSFMAKSSVSQKKKTKKTDPFVSSRYLALLRFSLQGSPIHKPKMPSEIKFVKSWKMLPTIGVQHWAGQLKELASKESEESAFSPYWVQWSWYSMAIAAVVKPFSKDLYNIYNVMGTDIFDHLVKNSLISAHQQEYFDVIKYLFVQNENSFDVLEPKEGNYFVAWYLRDINWLKSLVQSKSSLLGSNELPYNYNELAGTLERIRTIPFSKIQSYSSELAKLLRTDSESFHLWFLSAFLDFEWSKDKSDVSLNQKYQLASFVIALYPPFYQKVFWKNYATYLSKSTSEDLAKKALLNSDIISNKNSKIFNRGSWWDIGEQGFELEKIKKYLKVDSSSEKIDMKSLVALKHFSILNDFDESTFLYISDYYMFSDRPQKAKSFLLQSIAKHSNSIELLGRMACVSAEELEFDKAFGYIDRIKKLQKVKSIHSKYEGRVYSLAGEYETANELLLAYSSDNPSDGMAFLFLAEANLMSDDEESCLKHSQLAQAHGNVFVQDKSKVIASRCLIKAGVKKAENLVFLQNYVSAKNFSFSSLQDYYAASLDANSLPDFLQFINGNIEELGANPKLMYFRARALLGLERKEEALASLKIAWNIKSMSPRELFLISRLSFDFANYQKSYEGFKLLSERQASYPSIWLWLARSARRLSMDKESKNYYLREIKERPAVLSNLLEAGEYFLKKNLPAEVPKLVKNFSENYRDDPRVHTLLAKAFEGLNELERAKTHASISVKRNPIDADAYRVLANYYDQTQQYLLAKSHYFRYLKLKPRAPDKKDIERKLAKFPYTEER